MFKIGDPVRCTNARNSILKIDRIYTVTKVNEEGTLITVNGRQYYYAADRFNHSDYDVLGRQLLTAMSKRLENSKQQIVGICSYVLRFSDGREEWYIGDACHARLRVPLPAYEATHVVLNNSLNYSKLSVADQGYYIKYLDYILNKSPWANVFLNKSAEEVAEKGVLLDVTTGINHLVSAAIAMRLGTEYPRMLSVFNFLERMGFSSHVSWLLSQLCYVDGGDVFTGRIDYLNLNGSHHVISGNRSLEHVLQFLKTGEGIKLNNDVPFFKSGGKSYRILDYIAPISAHIDSINGKCEALLGTKRVEWRGLVPKMNSLRDLCRVGEFLENEIKEIV